MSALFDWDYTISQANTFGFSALKALGRAMESGDSDTRLCQLGQAQDMARRLVIFLDEIAPQVAAIVDGPKEEAPEDKKPASKRQNGSKVAGHV